MHNERRPSPLLLRDIDELHAIISANPHVSARTKNDEAETRR